MSTVLPFVRPVRTRGQPTPRRFAWHTPADASVRLGMTPYWVRLHMLGGSLPLRHLRGVPLVRLERQPARPVEPMKVINAEALSRLSTGEGLNPLQCGLGPATTPVRDRTHPPVCAGRLAHDVRR